MRIIEGISERGSMAKPNEDRWGNIGSTVWVLDGATGLNKGNPLVAGEGQTDASWLVTHANAFLLDKASEYQDDMRRLYKDLRGYLEARFKDEAIRMPKNKNEEPLSSGVVLYEDSRKITIGQLGDCIPIIETTDGIKSFLGSEVHHKIDEYSISQAHKLVLEGLPLLEAREKVLDIIRDGRNKANIEDGYWVIGITGEASEHANIYNLAVKKDGYALLMSDGFYSLVQTYNKYSDEELLEAVKDKGLEPLYKEIRQIENDDPEAFQYPRLKKGDDTTAVLVQFD